MDIAISISILYSISILLRSPEPLEGFSFVTSNFLKKKLSKVLCTLHNNAQLQHYFRHLLHVTLCPSKHMPRPVCIAVNSPFIKKKAPVNPLVIAVWLCLQKINLQRQSKTYCKLAEISINLYEWLFQEIFASENHSTQIMHFEKLPPEFPLEYLRFYCTQVFFNL